MATPALAGRFDNFGSEQNMLMAAPLINIIVLQKHRGGQNDIGVSRRFRHKLLVYTNKQIFALEPALDNILIGSN